MQLTFTQCKQMLANSGRAALDSFLYDMENQPHFLCYMDRIVSISTMQAILQDGCASGAYMPAVEYHTAKACLFEMHDSIEDWAGDMEIVFNPLEDSVASFAALLCSAAVENWCYQYSEILENVSWG